MDSKKHPATIVMIDFMIFFPPFPAFADSKAS